MQIQNVLTYLSISPLYPRVSRFSQIVQGQHMFPKKKAASPYTAKTPLQLRALLSSLLPLLISQLPPQNLPAGALGNLLNKFDAARQPLVPALVLFYVFLDIPNDQLIRLFDRARCPDYKGLGHFACAVVMHWYHGAVGHAGVCEQVCFQLGGRDL